MVIEIAKFFRTGQSPVSAGETIQIYAFMQAALVSKQRGGVPVTIDEVMKTAKVEAAKLLEGKL